MYVHFCFSLGKENWIVISSWKVLEVQIYNINTELLFAIQKVLDISKGEINEMYQKDV